MGKKAGILVVIALIISAIWFAGAEGLYARLLGTATNTLLSAGGRETRLSVEKDNGERIFLVHTVIDGRRAQFPQRMQSLLYPTIMVIAWQLFTGFTKGWKKSLRSGKWNVGVFFVFQIVFLLLLTAYHSSAAARFVYDMLMDSFYVIAVAIIIIDNIRDPSYFLRKAKEKGPHPG